MQGVHEAKVIGKSSKLGKSSEVIFPDSPGGLKSQKGLAMFPDGPSKVTAGIPELLAVILDEFRVCNQKYRRD